MNKELQFQRRDTFFPDGKETFYLSGSRMPYFHSNTLSVAAYGELVWQSGAKQYLYHSYWSFTCITEGEGVYREKNRTGIKTLPGDIYISRPGVDYTISVKQGNIQKRKTILMNCSPLLTLLCNSGALADKSVIHTKDPARFLHILSEIRLLVVKGSPHLHEELSTLAYSFIHEMIVQTAPADVKEGFEMIARELEQNPDKDFSLESLAEKYNTSTRTLNRLFHQHFQCSPHEFILHVRMTTAARLLQDNILPIKTIAEACGYKNLSFFAKSFRNFYGKTPRTYRSGMVITENMEKRHKSKKKRALSGKPGKAL